MEAGGRKRSTWPSVAGLAAPGLLVFEGKLDQAQLHIVEARIDELTRALRLSEMEETRDFLPVAFVRSARTVLTDAQKALVPERLEAWFGGLA